MPADRKTIYLPERVAAYYADAQTLSSRIAGVTLRYAEVCRRELPPLSKAEWCAVADANNGTDDLLLGDNPGSVGMMLWANVSDSPELAEKWEIDAAALVDKMRRWTCAQQVAVFEALRTFWIQRQKPTEEAMRLAGMIPPAKE